MSEAQAERFKWAMLRVATGDPPWYTGMAWGDAVDGLPGRSPDEVAQIVQESLLDLVDRGLIYFYRSTNFHEDFAEHDESEALDRKEVAEILTEGGESLCFRATEAGAAFFESLPEEASRLFPPREQA
jgi:hypothetical protein